MLPDYYFVQREYNEEVESQCFSSGVKRKGFWFTLVSIYAEIETEQFRHRHGRGKLPQNAYKSRRMCAFTHS